MKRAATAVGWGAVSQFGGMVGGALLALSVSLRLDQAEAGRLLLALNLGAFLAPIAGVGLVRMSMRFAVGGSRFVPSGLVARAAGSYVSVMVVAVPLLLLVFSSIRTTSLAVLLLTTVGSSLLALVASYYLIGVEEYRHSALAGIGAQRLIRGVAIGLVLWLDESSSIVAVAQVLVAVQLVHVVAVMALFVKRKSLDVDSELQKSHALVDSAIALSSGSITVLPRLAMSDSQYGLYALLLRFVAPVGAARQVLEPLLTARWLGGSRRPVLPSFGVLVTGCVVFAIVFALPLRVVATSLGLEGTGASVVFIAFCVLALACMEATASVWRGPILAVRDLLDGLALREVGLAAAVVVSALAFREFGNEGVGFVGALVVLEMGWLFSLSRLASAKEVLTPRQVAV